MKTVAVTARVVACAVVFGACGADDAVAAREQGILNGSAVGAGYRAAVALNVGCSGTLVRNDWVLTAARCFNVMNLGEPGSVGVTMGAQSAVADAIVRHGTLDVALVHLATPMAVNGSSTGHFQAMFLSPASGLLGDALDCVGSGYTTPSGGGGAVRHAMVPVVGVDADGVRYRLGPNALNQLPWTGDTGGACFDGDYLTGVQSSCTTEPGGALRCTQTALSAVANWVNDTIRASWTAANNQRANAWVIPVSQSESTVTGSTTGATHDAASAPCGCTVGPDVWYRFTLDRRSVVYLDTAGSTFDTSIVLTDAAGAPVGGMCNDDASCASGGFASRLESRVSGLLEPGTYFVAVGGCGAGAFTLHLQAQPTNAAAYFYTLPLAGDSTTSTVLTGAGLSSGTCGGAAAGEDARWFVTCGDEYQFFSVCPGDGGGFTRQTADGNTHDPVLYLRSAQLGADTACNDDGDAMVDCGGTGGDRARYGARLSGVRARRGLNTVYVDERNATSGMQYTLRYAVR